MQPSPGKKKKDACEAHVATWKSIFCGGKKIPLMSLKYLHCKGGGRQMWRSLVTMVIFWAFWPGSSSSYRAQDVGVGRWFQIPGEGLAGEPACQPTSQTSAAQRFGSPLPTNMSLVGAGVRLSCRLLSVSIREAELGGRGAAGKGLGGGHPAGMINTKGWRLHRLLCFGFLSPFFSYKFGV